jgi:PAS domain S-box-containing protein
MSESEKFYRLAVEAGRIGTWDLDLQTEECLISPEMAELMDFSPDQTTVPAAQWQEAIVPDDRTLMSSALAPSIVSDEPFDLEFRIALKDGTQRWLYSRGAVSRDASGKAVRMYGASIDITERKRAEEAQQLSNERITNILESITDAFVAVDRQWRFTYINERALTTLQRTREELLRKNMWEEFPEAVGLSAYREYHRAMSSGTSVHFEEFNPWLDIWVEINAYPSEGGLAIYFRDITDRKRAQEERDRLRTREIEARTQKEERRRIARDLHDMVLQDLAGVLQSLRLTYLQNKGSELGLNLEEELEALGRATLGLRSAVHDLRGENERPFVRSVESLVELHRRLTPDCRISLVVEEGFPSGLLGEAGGEMLRVIREALTNARQHSGAKSVVVSLKVEGSDLVAEISDDGEGFELEATPGVGLSSMQERAAMVDGKLVIESEVGQGTSVRLRVPVP